MHRLILLLTLAILHARVRGQTIPSGDGATVFTCPEETPLDVLYFDACGLGRAYLAHYSGAKASRDGFEHIGTRVRSGGGEVEVACSYGYREVSWRSVAGRADQTVMYDCVYTGTGDVRPALSSPSERCPELALPQTSTTFVHLAAIPPKPSTISKRSLGESVALRQLTQRYTRALTPGASPTRHCARPSLTSAPPPHTAIRKHSTACIPFQEEKSMHLESVTIPLIP